MARYGSTHCFLSRMKIAEILHQCTLDFLIPDTSRIRLTLHRLHNQDDLLSFAHNLYLSLINKLSIFVPFHSFPIFLSDFLNFA